MKVRKFDNSKDYEDACKWWSKQDWPEMPVQALSNYGFICEDNGTKLAATWVLPTGTCIYLMEWTVGNPDVDYKLRSEAVELVSKEAFKCAKELGALSIMTMSKNKRFIDKMVNMGFQKCDEEMTHLLRRL